MAVIGERTWRGAIRPAGQPAWRELAPSRSELIVAGVLLVLQVGLTVLFHHHHGGSAPTPGEWVLLCAGPLALLAWRRYPVAVMWVTFAATLGPSGARFAYLSLIVSYFFAAAGGHRQAAWVIIVVGYVGSLWVVPLVWGDAEGSLDNALILGGWLAVLVVAGEAVRIRRERVSETRAARQAEERRQASEERLRMARDLHDVIGHNISLINVQASVGLALMDKQPDQARSALVAVKAASKDALSELRSMLAALRAEGDEVPRAPLPGLDRLDDLMSMTRAAGLQVTVQRAGEGTALPAAVDVTAYRIVQESLTNVARHAPGARVTLRVDRRPEALEVEVADDGASLKTGAQPAAGAAGGTGITGMRERAVAVGGELFAGPRAGGGFVVRARLPLPAGLP